VKPTGRIVRRNREHGLIVLLDNTVEFRTQDRVRCGKPSALGNKWLSLHSHEAYSCPFGSLRIAKFARVGWNLAKVHLLNGLSPSRVAYLVCHGRGPRNGRPVDIQENECRILRRPRNYAGRFHLVPNATPVRRKIEMGRNEQEISIMVECH
jgi:hypothetical protein